MKKKLTQFCASFLAITLIWVGSAFADPSIRLTKDQTFKVPEDGIFFTVKEEKKIQFRLLDADYFEKAFKLEQNNNLLLQEQLKIQKEISEKYRQTWLESDDRLTEVLKRENRTKFWYLTLGILLTVGAGFAVGAASGF